MDQQQPIKSRWTDRGPFFVESGGSYSIDCKQQIDGRMMRSLGLDNIDDLLEMKAPNFYERIKIMKHNVDVIGQYCEYFTNELKKQQATLQQLSEQINELKCQLNNSSSFSR